MLLLYLGMVSPDGECDFVMRAYSTLNKRLLAFAYKLSGDEHWAQDATQQVFLELITNLPRYNLMTDDELARYCFTIVKNAFYRWSKQNTRMGNLELLDEDGGSDAGELVDAMIGRLDRQEIKRSLAALSELHRLVVMQKFAMGRSHKEIARDLGISESRSQNLLAEAIQAIRKMLGVR